MGEQEAKEEEGPEVEEGRRFANEERDPMTSKELNEEPYEVKISCTVL